jgi:hypothetical protein
MIRLELNKQEETIMARNWGKKYEEVSKKISKKGKLAAEGHHLKQEADKKLATESLEDKMKRTGVENFATGEVVDYNKANADDDVWGFMNKSFYNRLIADTTKSIEEKVELEMMENFKAMLNEVLDAREVKNRELDLAMAKETTRQLELQLELARLNAATPTEPVVFELESFIPVTTEGKLEEVMEEHAAAVETILDAIQVAEEKPAKKKRMGRPKGSKNKVEEVPETVNPDLGKLREIIALKKPVFGVDYFPIRKGRSGYSIAWKQVIEENCLNTVVRSLVEFALEAGIDVRDTNAFRKFHPVCQGAYMQYVKQFNNTKGVWKEFIDFLGL